MSYPQQPGQYPGQSGPYPQQSGPYPQQPGQYPQQPGQYPQQPGQYPQQSGPYPQQPGQYPGQPGPMPPFPGGVDVEREPSKGTTIAAAILAVLGALAALVFAVVNFGSLSDLRALGVDIVWLAWTQGIAYVIEVLTLGPGAMLLFMRRDAGRWLVTAGSAVHIIQGIIGVVTVFGLVTEPGQMRAAELSGSVFGALVVLSPAIATIILALLPPTGRWLNWNRRRQNQTPPQQWGQAPPQQWW